MTFLIFESGAPLYSLLVMAGLGSGVAVSCLLAPRRSVAREDVLFAELYAMLGLVAGGKLLYLLVEAGPLWRLYRAGASPRALLIGSLQGGFVFYGGLLGALFCFYLYARRYRQPFWRLLAPATPALPLAHAFGRIGCLLVGCCYGRPYGGPLPGVCYEAALGGAPLGVRLFLCSWRRAAQIWYFFWFCYVCSAGAGRDGGCWPFICSAMARCAFRWNFCAATACAVCFSACQRRSGLVWR